MTIKDELDYWKEGFEDHQKLLFEMIREATKQDFKNVAELIIYIRKQESNNETE